MAFTVRDWIGVLVHTVSEIGQITPQEDLEAYQRKVRNITEHMPRELIVSGTGRTLDGTTADCRASQPLTPSIFVGDVINTNLCGLPFPEITHGSDEIVYETPAGSPLTYIGLNEIGRVLAVGWSCSMCIPTTCCLSVISGVTSCTSCNCLVTIFGNLLVCGCSC